MARVAAGGPLRVLRVPRPLRTQGETLSRLVLDERAYRDPLCRSWLIVETAGSAPAAADATVCVVLGLSGRPEELVSQRGAKALGGNFSMIRRFSGGGTVALDKDSQLISLVASVPDVRPFVAPFPRDIMQWSADRIYTPGMTPLLQPQYAPFAARENDYVVAGGERKMGGNAQAIGRGADKRARFVHHTSLLHAVRPSTMEVLSLPAKRPAYRGSRDHSDFLIGLRDAVRPELLRGGPLPEVVLDALLPWVVEAIGASHVVHVESPEDYPPPLAVDSRNRAETLALDDSTAVGRALVAP